ncbi:MAG: HNH endonuclease signature motif containing protein [Actinobacteria bacterium]|nr:HNH endonuclease signature motif containing protein [Actinomycetota bacterium]
MPYKPKYPCNYSMCSNLSEPGQSYCNIHKQHKNTYDDRRDNSNKRGYNSRWHKARLMYLRSNPLCVMCLEQGYTVSATIVDHIEPHRGEYEKFWDEDNWQSLCKTHHDRKTRKGK